jgi:hypothetical protein
MCSNQSSLELYVNVLHVLVVDKPLVCVGGVVRLVSIVVIAWLARADLVPLHVDLALGGSVALDVHLVLGRIWCACPRIWPLAGSRALPRLTLGRIWCPSTWIWPLAKSGLCPQVSILAGSCGPR